jgi:RNA polymerase sigma-70 factor (ECF subfamily)
MVMAPAHGGGSAEAALLSERVLRGDRAAENHVVAIYSGQVLALAMVHTRDREVSRELVDDVMMATVTALRRGTVHDTARLGAFVHGTALNLIHNHLRERGRRAPTHALGDGPTTPDLAEACETDSDMQELMNCVGRLPLQHRQVLLLSVIDGLKPCEIAARLGLPAGVVRQQKCRALKRLREAWNS